MSASSFGSSKPSDTGSRSGSVVVVSGLSMADFGGRSFSMAGVFCLSWWRFAPAFVLAVDHFWSLDFFLCCFGESERGRV